MDRRGLRADEGAASVTACLALVGLIVLTSLLAQVGMIVVARHRIQAAADLAALAGAAALLEGVQAGCTEARVLAQRMRARVTECDVTDWDVLLTVEEKVPIGLFGARSVRAIARAGPVREGDQCAHAQFC
ncbi:Rv3654c family TadE-like protein [Nocardia donostiensis]|uniref:Pilus assembly protein TadE n=1 Tax=Nocardia donostiensis TaxID=1538463 RepID=A0A1V2TD27_9NOCA|nr:Rv3654c family TadE-like protein [Nocardia donostiensis]ONM47420.1 pilus assembly protein TadE [Nocardia donostiensis]OQS14351.1 pilus assembly protein TadE [Nocardia donostiensis]OQS24114.1 pilus assembly protein TadE [Nocardia donostiensis]